MPSRQLYIDFRGSHINPGSCMVGVLKSFWYPSILTVLVYILFGIRSAVYLSLCYNTLRYQSSVCLFTACVSGLRRYD